MKSAIVSLKEKNVEGILIDDYVWCFDETTKEWECLGIEKNVPLLSRKKSVHTIQEYIQDEDENWNLETCIVRGGIVWFYDYDLSDWTNCGEPEDVSKSSDIVQQCINDQHKENITGVLY